MILLGSHGSTPYIQNLKQKQPSCILYHAKKLMDDVNGEHQISQGQL